MSIERREIVNRDVWLKEWRPPYVGASETPALFDAHQYLTQLKLHIAKRGVDFFYDDNKVLRRGRWMEPAIGKAVAELRPDWGVTPAKDFYCTSDPPMSATPDFYVKSERGIGTLQTKSVAWSVWHEQWRDGTEVPLGVLIQASQEAYMADAAFAACAVLLVDPHAMDCKIFEFDRNPAVEAKIIAAIRDFWDDVAAGREPQPDFARDTEAIRALYPRETPGRTLDLSGDNHLPVLLEERATLAATCKGIETRLDEIDNELKFTLKDADVATLPGWRLTFRTSEYKAYQVPARSNRILRVYDKREAR